MPAQPNKAKNRSSRSSSQAGLPKEDKIGAVTPPTREVSAPSSASAHGNNLVKYFIEEAKRELGKMYGDEDGEKCELVTSEYDCLRKKDGQDTIRALANNRRQAVVLITPKMSTAVLFTGAPPSTPVPLEADGTTFFEMPVLSKAAFGMRTVKILMGADQAVWMTPLEPKRCRIGMLYRETGKRGADTLVDHDCENAREIAAALQQLIREAQVEREALSIERKASQKLADHIKTLRQQWYDQAFGGNHG